MDKTILFYRDVLGMTLQSFYPEGATEKRYSLNFGNQKINLHQSDSRIIHMLVSLCQELQIFVF